MGDIKDSRYKIKLHWDRIIGDINLGKAKKHIYEELVAEGIYDHSYHSFFRMLNSLIAKEEKQKVAPSKALTPRPVPTPIQNYPRDVNQEEKLKQESSAEISKSIYGEQPDD